MNQFCFFYFEVFLQFFLFQFDGFLSTLQYYKYKPLNGTKNIVRIIDIIDMLISKCNAYSKYYISNATQLNSTTNECLSNNLYISEQNFFDEDDEAMTLQEVLEEICKYLNVTCVAEVVEHGKGDKIVVYKYKPKKNYRRKQGHRQPYTAIKIVEIK